MRLQFSLNQIKLSPVSHIQIARHAEEYQNRYATGLLYGALYDDQAQITNVMPFPDTEKLSTKEELEAMQSRHDESLTNFFLDSSKLGWYMVCYKQNFWDGLETIQYYEKYINTSFFLVYDYKARVKGTNPYKAYRLTDDFALKTDFCWKDLQSLNPKINNPFVEIPVVVKKNQLFQSLMLFNKSSFLKAFEQKRKQKSSIPKYSVEEMTSDYIQSLDEHVELQKTYNDYSTRENSEKAKKDITFNGFCEYAGQQLKIQQQEQEFKTYHKDLKISEKVFDQNL